jgi:hypothetical protein
MKHVSLFLFALLLLPGLGVSSEEENSSRAGPDKAVTAFSKEDGFKLSPQAIEKMGIRFEFIQGKAPWRVPKEALVYLKQSVGVYRQFEGWMSFVLVKVDQKNSDSALIQSNDLEGGDGIAVRGAHFLRMTDADLNSDAVDACAH